MKHRPILARSYNWRDGSGGNWPHSETWGGWQPQSGDEQSQAGREQPVSIFSGLFSPASSAEALKQYLTALTQYRKAEHALKDLNPEQQGVTAEETIRLYGRLYGVRCSWTHAEDVN